MFYTIRITKKEFKILYFFEVLEISGNILGYFKLLFFNDFYKNFLFYLYRKKIQVLGYLTI